MPAQPLTDASVKAMKAAGGKRMDVPDSRCRGLELRVTVSGQKTWCFRFRDKSTGKTQRLTLGQYPVLGLSDARARAIAASRRVTEGGSPIQDRKAARELAAQRDADAQAHAWERLAELYLAKHARPKKRSASYDEDLLRLHVTPLWAGRDFRTIRRQDCISLLEGVAETGKGALANRLRPLLSKIFKFATDRSLLDASPALTLPKPAEDLARDRVLSDAEIRLLWSATSGAAPFSSTVALALRLILVTGARPGEVAGMNESELSELDSRGEAVWRVPAGRMKGKRPHAVPLTPLAVSIIRDARAIVDDAAERRAQASDASPQPVGTRAIFASPRGIPGADPIDAHALARAMARLGPSLAKGPVEGSPAWATAAGCDSWQVNAPTPHDLRRTAATGMRSLGVSISDVQAVLGHVRRDVLGLHYDWHDAMGEKRAALTRWAVALERIISAEAAQTVVELRPRQAGAA
ncbi:tyrosine-type recombinase/integrase [Methylobacterium soli]|uniref:Site-specific integrase n=1 Tax=Methylobacterium soli TaxID=553447 RepID=A0A6L3T2F3_9HYPH|nr:site-specific integrase [Methylobacterium soli]KAB1080912.1 site-specific integrase [Methylobacterium soli]GJE44636.1 Prophage integrase IntA [Methylobacterium soli]